MSTTDVPGSVPSNGDELKVGCWAEAKDGSLIFVEGFENGTVTYSIFDLSTDPITDYRDQMAEKGFRDLFAKTKDWTWRDKTPFPWAKVVKAGARPGARFASAHDELSAAARLAQSLELRAGKLEEKEAKNLAGRYGWIDKASTAMYALGDLLETLKGMRG